jgi:hypothetical protein
MRHHKLSPVDLVRSAAFMSGANNPLSNDEALNPAGSSENQTTSGFNPVEGPEYWRGALWAELPGSGLAAAAPAIPQLSALPDLTGEQYIAFLRRLHAHLEPETYLEIGTNKGESLAVARCRSLAIDPRFLLEEDVVGSKEACLLFQMPSDRFFAKYDPEALLGKAVDLAFLDGMHLAEYLYRDFVNVERHCTRNSVILLHDCIPTDVYITLRDMDSPLREQFSTRPGWWAGDVWKFVVLLKRLRKDLVIHAFDAAPTGLIAVTNLDPSSNVLSEAYFAALREIQSLDLLKYGLARYIDELSIVSASGLRNTEQFSSLFSAF